MSDKKPLKISAELISHLKDKGVQFNIIDEYSAEQYLKNNNNYFKLASFRKNYDKYIGGSNDGKYINLDFAYLKDLAIIDMELRYIVVQMALDIEHYVKMHLLSIVENNMDEDGYTICADYIASLDADQTRKLQNEIDRNKNNIYCGSVVNKYKNEWPIWAFLEVIPFGRLVSFYEFCARRFDDDKMLAMYYCLLTCKDVRNAAAHSSCILNDLHRKTAIHRASNNINRAIVKSGRVSKKTFKSCMSNARLQAIVTLLYTHKKVVTSEGVHKKMCSLLQEFKDRMFVNADYYSKNPLIATSFKFISDIIDIWYN